jgi:hypothetical protein
VNALLRVLIAWITLLALPLQGFASATMVLRAPPASAAHGHAAHAAHAAHARVHDERAGADRRADHPDGSHHQSGKCASCAACCAFMPLASSFVAVPAAAPPASITVPFAQRLLPSVYLALPERPPRA